MTTKNVGRTAKTGLAKAPTGIQGLDELTRGGLPRGRPTLVKKLPLTLREDGLVTYCNAQMARMLGTPHQGLLGKRFQAFLASASLPLFKALLRQCHQAAAAKSPSRPPTAQRCQQCWRSDLKRNETHYRD